MFKLLVLLASLVSAEPVKTIFNPFSGKLDFITTLTSTTLPSGSTYYLSVSSPIASGSMDINGQDAAGFSLKLSSGIYSPAGVFLSSYTRTNRLQNPQGGNFFHGPDIGPVPVGNRVITDIDDDGLLTYRVDADTTTGNEVTNTANATLTRSGSGTTLSPYNLEINLANNNQWTGTSTIIDNLLVNTNGAAFRAQADTDAALIFSSINSGAFRFLGTTANQVLMINAATNAGQLTIGNQNVAGVVSTFTSTGNLLVAGGVTISSGSNVRNWLVGGFQSNAPSVAAASTLDHSAVATGLNAGDICSINAYALEANLTVDVSSASLNVLSFRFNNPSTLAVDPANQIYRYFCVRP